MAWEWVGPVTGAVVGLAGIVTAAIGQQQGRNHEAKLAQMTSNQTLSLTRDERRQQRLADTYVELLLFTEKCGQWASVVHPMSDTDPPAPLPGQPTLADEAHVKSLLNAYGTQAARDSWDQWLTLFVEIRRAAFVISMAGRKSDVTELREKLDLELRGAERGARHRLAEQINAELSERG